MRTFKLINAYLLEGQSIDQHELSNANHQSKVWCWSADDAVINSGQVVGICWAATPVPESCTLNRVDTCTIWSKKWFRHLNDKIIMQLPRSLCGSLHIAVPGSDHRAMLIKFRLEAQPPTTFEFVLIYSPGLCMHMSCSTTSASFP